MPSSREPARDAGGRMGAAGSAEVSLCIESWISGGVSDS
jgi:hypothetical protein